MNELTIDNCTIINGNCFDILPGLDVAVDAVISDPPFACTDLEWDTRIPLDRFWELMEAKTKPAANFALFATMRFGVDLINSRRNFFRYDIVWSKNTKCGFLWSKHAVLRSHELILLFTRAGEFLKATYNPQRTPGGRVDTTRRINRNPGGVYGRTNSCTTIRDGLIHPSSVLCFDSDRGHNKGILHPTQKPLALIEWLIQTYTNEGDTVLDPFMGSGTTALAAKRLNRKFIGIELDKTYYNVAHQRLAQARQHFSLF